MQVAPARGAEEIVHHCGGVAVMLALLGCPVPTQGPSWQAAATQLHSQPSRQQPSQLPVTGSTILGFGQYEGVRRALQDARRRVGLELLSKDGSIPAPVMAAVRCAPEVIAAAAMDCLWHLNPSREVIPGSLG